MPVSNTVNPRPAMLRHPNPGRDHNTATIRRTQKIKVL
jgi:hypothetical protein